MYIVLYSYMVYISFVFKFFGMTQRRALICCSVHFIPLLIRRVVRVDRTFTDVHIHMHKYIHINIYFYIHVYVYLYMYVCTFVKGPCFCYGRSTCLHIHIILMGHLSFPAPLPQHTDRPLALLAYSNPASAHTTLFPYFDLDSVRSWTRAWSPASLSLSLHSAVAFGFVVRHARFV